MANPNLLVESSVPDVADLIAALACHVGEVRRNPYHARLPAWMMDKCAAARSWWAGRAARRRISRSPLLPVAKVG